MKPIERCAPEITVSVVLLGIEDDCPELPFVSWSNGLQFVEPKTRTYHGWVEAGRRGGAAEPGEAGLEADGTVRRGNNRPSCPLRHREKLS